MQAIYRLTSLQIILLLGALPFFLQSAFEAYLLTWMRGPQSMFFALAHNDTLWKPVVIISAVFYVFLVLYGIYIVVRQAAKPGSFSRHQYLLFASVFVVLVLHTGLIASYDWWVDKLYPRSDRFYPF